MASLSVGQALSSFPLLCSSTDLSCPLVPQESAPHARRRCFLMSKHKEEEGGLEGFDLK